MAEILTLEPWGDEQDTDGRRRLAIRHTPVSGRGLMITYADVTEERATQRKLRENEERYSRVTEAVAEGIYDWNIVDNTLYVSDRVMEIFGFEGRLTSRDWYLRVHPDDAEAYREALRESEPDPTLLFNLGVLLEDASRNEEAIDAYQQALGEDPDFADAHYNLARLYEAVGKPQHAIRHLGVYRRLLKS